MVLILLSPFWVDIDFFDKPILAEFNARAGGP
jgi:hypothetical protein